MHCARAQSLPSGDLPDPGIEPTSTVSHALWAGSLPTEPPGKPKHTHCTPIQNFKSFKKY